MHRFAMVLVPLAFALLAAGQTRADVPIGSIMAWHKSFPNTPSLPAGWVECNGQILNEPGSPYDGQTIPDLNGALSNVQRFIRGGGDGVGGTSSGTTQLDVLGTHTHVDSGHSHLAGTHNHSQAAHSHTTTIQINDAGSTFNGVGRQTGVGIQAFLPFASDSASGALSPAATVIENALAQIQAAGGSETRPVNVSMVWVMKVEADPVLAPAVPRWGMLLIGMLIVVTAERFVRRDRRLRRAVLT